MKCEQFKKYMGLYLTGRLPEKLTREFESHRELCPSCHSELSGSERLHDREGHSKSETTPDHLFKSEFISEPSKDYWQELPEKIVARLPHEAHSRGVLASAFDILAGIMSRKGLAWKLAGSLGVVCIALLIGRGVHLFRSPVGAQRELAASMQRQNEEIAAAAASQGSGGDVRSRRQGSGDSQLLDTTQPGEQIPAQVAAPASQGLAIDQSVKNQAAQKPTGQLPTAEPGVASVQTADAGRQLRDETIAVERKDMQRTAAASAQMKGATGEERKTGMVLTASERGVTKLSGEEAGIPSAPGTEAKIADAPTIWSRAQVEPRLLPYLYMTLLSQREFEECQRGVAELDSTAATGDSDEATRAVVMLGRFYFTHAVTDTTGASHQKTLEYWLAHENELSATIGAEQTSGVIEYLKLAIKQSHDS